MTRCAARDLSPLPRLASVELRDEHRALGRSTQRRLQRRHHSVSLENEFPFQSLMTQSCSVQAVADAVAHAGPPPEGLDGPGALSELRVARGYMDTPVHLAPLDVGALALPPRGLQRRSLDELVGRSFAREIVLRLSAKLLPKAAQVETQWDRTVAYHEGMSTLVWASAAI